jgi:hypothetical protein
MRRQHLQWPNLFRLEKLLSGYSKHVRFQRLSGSHQRGYRVPPLESTVLKKMENKRVVMRKSIKLRKRSLDFAQTKCAKLHLHVLSRIRSRLSSLVVIHVLDSPCQSWCIPCRRRIRLVEEWRKMPTRPRLSDRDHRRPCPWT